jgi:hypothetical protein
MYIYNIHIYNIYIYIYIIHIYVYICVCVCVCVCVCIYIYIYIIYKYIYICTNTYKSHDPCVYILGKYHRFLLIYTHRGHDCYTDVVAAFERKFGSV